MNKKLIKCKTCQADIAKSAKFCPSCGAKNKKPIYARWWVWAILIVVIVGVFGDSSELTKNNTTTASTNQTNNPTSTPPPASTPKPETKKDKKVEVTILGAEIGKDYQGEPILIVESLDAMLASGVVLPPPSPPNSPYLSSRPNQHQALIFPRQLLKEHK